MRVPTGKQLLAGQLLQSASRSKYALLHSGKSFDKFLTGAVQRLLGVLVQRGGDADGGKEQIAQLLIDVRIVLHGLAQLLRFLC